MAGSFDMTVFFGRLAKDPERISSPVGGRSASYVRFEVVINKLAKDEKYGWQRTSDFFWVHCYDRLSEIAEKYLYRGCVVAVVGGLTRVKNDVIIQARDIQLIGDCLVCRDQRRAS